MRILIKKRIKSIKELKECALNYNLYSYEEDRISIFCRLFNESLPTDKELKSIFDNGMYLEYYRLIESNNVEGIY